MHFYQKYIQSHSSIHSFVAEQTHLAMLVTSELFLYKPKDKVNFFQD